MWRYVAKCLSRLGEFVRSQFTVFFWFFTFVDTTFNYYLTTIIITIHFQFNNNKIDKHVLSRSLQFYYIVICVMKDWKKEKLTFWLQNYRWHFYTIIYHKSFITDTTNYFTIYWVPDQAQCNKRKEKFSYWNFHFGVS